MENVHVFVNQSSHSSWTELVDELGGLQRTSMKFWTYSISLRYWYWSILKKFWRWIRLTVHLPHGRDQYCLMIKWFNGQKARVPVRSDSVLCLGKMNESKDAITRWEGQVEGSKNVSLENCWRSSWIRVEYFPRIYVIADSSEDPGWLARTEHRDWKNSQVGSSSCQCSTTSIGERKEMMEFVFRIQKKSRSTRRDAREDTGHFWVLETKRSGMELFLTHLKENEILQPVKWWNDSKIQVIQYSGVLVLLVVKFWKRRMAETPYTSIRMLEQFGRTEEEKGQEKQKESVTKDALTCVKSQEVKLLVSLQNNYLEPVCGKTIRTSNHWPRQFDSQGFANSHRSAQVSAGMNSKTRPDGDDGFGQIIPYCREYILSRAHPQSRIFAALPGGTIIGPVIEVQIVKIIDHCGFEIAVPSPNDRERTFYVMIFPEERVGSWMKSIFPNAELRSSADLLIELQKAEGEKSCLGQSKTSIQEIGAAHGSSHTRNKETCADTLNILPSEASLFHAKNHSYDWEEVDFELMVFFRILYNVKEYIFHRCCSFKHSIYPWERIDSGWTWKRQRTADCLFHTTWPFWLRFRRRRTLWWLHSSSKRAPTQSLKTKSRCRVLGKIVPSTRSRIAIPTDEVTCNHRTQSCASSLHLQSYLSKRWSNVVRRLSTPRPAQK